VHLWPHLSDSLSFGLYCRHVEHAPASYDLGATGLRLMMNPDGKDVDLEMGERWPQGALVSPFSEERILGVGVFLSP
jgi:hypothetical protein